MKLAGLCGMNIRKAANFSLILAAALILGTANISSGADIVWTNTAGGSWSGETNWDLNRVPGPDDDVFINLDGTYTVTADNLVPVQAHNLTLGASNGTQSLLLSHVLNSNSAPFNLSGNIFVLTNGVCTVDRPIDYDQMIVDGKLIWILGDLGGPITVQTNGSLTVMHAVSKRMISDITNQGTIIWNEPDPFAGNETSSLMNQGVFILHTNMLLTGSAKFINSGTILQPAGMANSLQNLQAYFTNSGTIHVETNASLALAATWPYTLDLTDGTVISGPGLLRFVSYSIMSVLNANGTITVDGNFELFSGFLFGDQTWTGAGTFNWLGGVLYGPGTTTFGTNLHIIISGYDQKYLDDRTLVNQGTINWLSGTISAQTYPGTFINDNLLIFQSQTGGLGGVGPFAPPVFQNNGTMLFPAEGGLLQFNSSWNFTNSGTLTVQSNTVLQLISMGFGSVNLADGTLINGPGKIHVPSFSELNANGTITVDGTFELAGQQFSGGRLKGTQTWIGSGNFNWIGGGMVGAGTTTIGTNFNLNISSFEGMFLDGHTLVNRGTVNWLSGGVYSENNAGNFINDNLLVFQCQNGGFGGPDYGSVFQNNGTILCPADLGLLQFRSNWNLTNSGTLTVQSNTVLELFREGSGSVNLADGTLINGPGKTRVSSFSECSANGTITVDGTFELAGQQFSGGRLKGTQTWIGSGNFNWIGGGMVGAGTTTIGTNFNLNISSFEGMFLDGHTLVNRGTVNWLSGDVNSENNAGNFINDNLLVFQCQNGGFGGPDYGSVFQNNGTILCPADLGPQIFFNNWNLTNNGTLTVQSNTLLDFVQSGSGSLNFADGTLINGAGRTRIAYSELIANGTITVDGTFDLTSQQGYAGILKGTQTWTGSGSFNWVGGGMVGAGTTTIGTNFTFNISGPSVSGPSQFLDGHTLLNRGIINWLTGAGGVSSENNAGAFINDNLLYLYGGGGLVGPNLGSVFQNNGIILCPADLGTLFLSSSWNFTNHGTLTVQSNTTLELMRNGSGSINLADGTLINGLGKTRVSYGEINANGILAVEGTFELAYQSFPGGALRGAQTWIGSGDFNWIGGGMVGPGTTTIETNLNLNISGLGPKTMDSHILLNRGTVNWDSVIVHSGDNPSTFINDNLVVYRGGGLSIVGLRNNPVFQNNGTILCPPDEGILNFQCSWNFTNSGTLTVQSNTVLSFLNLYIDSLNFADGTLINGLGKTRITGTELIANGTITVDGTLELVSISATNGPNKHFVPAILKGTQIWTGSGNLNWAGGNITGPGISTIAENFHLNIQGADPKSLNNHTLQNQGIITFNSSLQGSTNAIINNAGLFNVSDFCTFASVDGTAAFNNLAGGTISTPGTNAPSSQTECTMNWAFSNAGMLAIDSGTFNISPAYSPAASSTHHLGLASTGSGLLKLSTFSPAGTLEVALGNSVVVTNGSAFQLITYTNRTGTFVSKNLPPLPTPLSWELDYQPTALFLKAVSIPLELKSAHKLADGSFQISATGATGSDYVIETSTNLVNWAALQTNTAVNGLVNFIDTSATNFNQRFYRMRTAE